jgi:hypothetical protein
MRVAEPTVRQRDGRNRGWSEAVEVAVYCDVLNHSIAACLSVFWLPPGVRIRPVLSMPEIRTASAQSRYSRR